MSLRLTAEWPTDSYVMMRFVFLKQ